MNEGRNKIWLGAWLIALPLFGIPGVWKLRLVVCTGVLLLVAAFLSRYRKEA